MDWKTYYQTRLTTAEAAVGRICSGDRVVIGHAAGEPSHLVEKMVECAQSYQDVELVHMVAMGECAYCRPEYKKNFRHNTIFVGKNSREAVHSGRAEFTPAFFFEVPKLFAQALPVNVALVMVTPPNQEGRCSLGVSVDYTYEAIKRADTVIAQVNRKLPWTDGALVDVTDIDSFVPFDSPLIPLAQPSVGAVEAEIGRNCASLIHDGDTLQLGIGAIPDAVLRFLDDKQDLGIHSEMFSDGVMRLMKQGVITNRKKTLHPGKSIANFLMGSTEFYRFVDHNPDIALYPADYVNHPLTIAKNDNLVSINSCVQVDLFGQVASESIGAKQISGVGGQVDFVRGAALSKGGRSIIAMPSLTGKKESKIVAQLSPGTAVTTSRNDVDYVVTEYGVAKLKGRTLRQRAEALISVAHPDFRQELAARY